MKKTIEIPVEEYEALKSGLERANAKISLLMEQLDWFRRQIFGQKSERLVDVSDDGPLIPGFELPEHEQVEPEKVKIPEHDRKKRKKKGDYTLTFPDDMPVVEKVIDVPKLERTLEDGTEMVRIGEDVSIKLAQRPAEYYIKKYIYPKYAMPNDPSLGVVQEPAVESIIKGSKFDPSFMAGMVADKMCFHMPLYRIVEKLSYRGVGVARQTLSCLFVTLGQRILPLYELMFERVLSQTCIFTDDTTVKLIEKGRGKAIEARIWVYVGGQANAPPYQLYEFTENRKHEHPIRRLADFKGGFHADAYGAYETLDAERDDLVWYACWAHSRRKFEPIPSGETDFCLMILRKMRYLFLFERIAWERDAKERLRIRKEHEEPIVDEIFRLMKEKVKQGDILPSSNFAKALGYMLCREKNFRNYLHNADARMENNTAERAIRKLVLGRKAWLFVGSKDGGVSTAALLSLVQTCRALEINPYDYLEDLFSQPLPKTEKELEKFLPDQWKLRKEKEREKAKHEAGEAVNMGVN